MPYFSLFDCLFGSRKDTESIHEENIRVFLPASSKHPIHQRRRSSSLPLGLVTKSTITLPLPEVARDPSKK